MYDWPEVQSAWDQVWAQWRVELELVVGATPEKLTRFADAQFKASWSHPELLITQICALPYAIGHVGKLFPFAAFDLDIDGFESSGLHRSAIIVREDDPRTSVMAFRDAQRARNSACSQTGNNALAMTLPDWPFFDLPPFDSGSHRSSARAIAVGRADIACVDPFSWWLLKRYEPETAARLRVLDWTNAFPSLPLVLTQPREVHLKPVAVDGLPLIKTVPVDEELYTQGIAILNH